MLGVRDVFHGRVSDSGWSCVLQIGNLFGKHRSTIITMYNGAFDSSSVVFLIIKVEGGSSPCSSPLLLAGPWGGRQASIISFQRRRREPGLRLVFRNKFQPRILTWTFCMIKCADYDSVNFATFIVSKCAVQ